MSLQQSFLSKYKPNQALQPTAPLRYALMLILASVIQRAAGRLDVKPARIFGFDEIREAHRVMEANEAVGKMVVVCA
jgi:NADPH:quinone reductase-like Zn-dependent oxidoreductase